VPCGAPYLTSILRCFSLPSVSRVSKGVVPGRAHFVFRDIIGDYFTVFPCRMSQGSSRRGISPLCKQRGVSAAAGEAKGCIERCHQMHGNEPWVGEWSRAPRTCARGEVSSRRVQKYKFHFSSDKLDDAKNASTFLGISIRFGFLLESTLPGRMSGTDNR
jgi:hypothetical protein